MRKKQRIPHLVLELAVLLAAVLTWLNPLGRTAYRRYVTDSLHYLRASVLAVTAETLTDSTLGTGQKLGEQTLCVRLSDGREVTLTNYLTETHNVLLKAGDRAIICADTPENAAPYYTVYQYDRTVPLLALIALFVLLMAAVGRRKGLDACLSIAFALAFVLRVLLPALYNGAPPVWMGLLTVLLATALTLLLLHGATMACALSIGATMIGEVIACALFAAFSGALHLTGFQSDCAEGLLLIAQSTGLEIRTLLFAGMMISALGAVMDVAVSVLSAVREVALAAGSQKRTELFCSAMRLGRDMIGTMSNTLIFAFAGNALATMLSLTAYGVQSAQLLNSDYIALEIAQGLCGTGGVILTVPIASAAAAALFSRWKAPDRKPVHI